MVSSLRDSCAVAARPLLLAALLALAWLIWGASTADAATADPGSGSTSSAGSHSASDAGPAALLGRGPALPLGQAAEAAAAVARPVTHAAAATATAVATNAAPILDTAASAVTAVTASGASVLPMASEVIHQAAGAEPVELPVTVRVTLPVELPDVATQLVRQPALETVDRDAVQSDAAAAAAGTPAPAAMPMETKATAPAPAWPSLTPEQLLFNAPVVTATAAAERQPAPGTAPDAEQQLRLSALGSRSGAPSSSAGGAGAAAAGDAAGFWNPVQAGRSALAPDLEQGPPAKPSFDPGSSPD